MLTSKIIVQLNDIYSLDENEHTYCEKIGELHDQNGNDNEKKILELFYKVQHPYLDLKNADNSYRLNTENVDGVIEVNGGDFSENDITILQLLDLRVLPLMLRTRISDVLWVIKKDFKMAELASSLYLILAKQYISNTEKFYYGVDCIERSMQISQQLGKKNATHKQWFEVTEKILMNISSENDTWVPNRIIGFLLMPFFNAYCLDGNKEKYMNILNKQIQQWSESFNSSKFLKDAFTTIKTIHKGNNEKIKEYDLKLAAIYKQYVEQVNDDSPNMVYAAIDMLNYARIIYQKYAMVDQEREIVDIIEPLQQKVCSFMKPIERSIDSSCFVGEFPSILENIKKEEKLDFLSEITRFYDKEKTVQQVIDNKKQFPLSSWLSKNILNERGELEVHLQPIPDKFDLDKDKDIIMRHAHHEATQYKLSFYAYFLSIILNNIKGEAWEAKDLEFLFINNWLIPENVVDSIIKGFIIGLSGDVNAAASNFLLAIEPIVRNYVSACGGVITLLREDNTTDLKTLGSLLKGEKFVDSCDENILFTFEAFFNSKAGANVKNNFSHGRNNWQKNTIANTYLLCLILKLCYIGSLEGCLRNIKFKENKYYQQACERWTEHARSRVIKETENKD